MIISAKEFQLRSTIDGRQRWDVSALFERLAFSSRQKKWFIKKLEQESLALPGVHSFSGNLATSRILVTFDPRTHKTPLNSFWAALIEREITHPAAINQPVNSPLSLLKFANVDKISFLKPVLLTSSASIISGVGPLSLGLMFATVIGVGIPLLSALGIIQPLAQLALLGVIYLLSSTITGYLRHHSHLAWDRRANQLESSLRDRLVVHVNQADMASLNKEDSGELLNLVVDDVAKIKQFVQHVPNSVIRRVLSLATSAGVVFLLSPNALFLALLPLPFVYLATSEKRTRNARYYKELALKQAEYSQMLMGDLDSMVDIKGFNAEAREQQSLHSVGATVIRQMDVVNEQNSFIREVTQLGVGLGLGASYAYTTAQVIGGAFSLQSLFMQASLIPLIIANTENLDLEFHRYQQAQAAAGRIQRLAAVKPEILSGNHPHLVRHNTGSDVEFSHVTFSYTPEQPVLHDINFHIPAGSTVAFVGGTGSGKSTLVKLLLRLYEVDDGAISLDGLDIRELQLDELRRAIATVNQNVQLNQRTIHDNIVYAYPEASREAVMEAAERAQALDFIEALPEGFATILEEDGQNLSGGERQRIAIARALLKKASVFILDEATSSLDSRTESRLQQSLRVLEQGQTTIIIAHKLFSVTHADVIYVLDQGRIIEQGNHETLMAANGTYHEMWHSQMLDD